MNVIGEQIKKYRVERGITQENLGELVGVTTQAVSRWERGGTPDVELLPKLSEVLGVSIDALFGQEEQSMGLALARRLSSLPEEEAYRYAFNMCWAIEIGLIGDADAIDDFMKMMVEGTFASDSKSSDHFARVIKDSGVSSVRLSPDLRDFFLMVEPKGSIATRLADMESLRKVFAVFADEKMLRIIYYVYSMPDISVSTALISKSMGIHKEEVERCMAVLEERHIVDRFVVSTAAGEINSYMIRRESYAIPLLCFADELAHDDFRTVAGVFERNKPLL